MMVNSGNAPALNVILYIQGLESDISFVPALFFSLGYSFDLLLIYGGLEAGVLERVARVGVFC